jgi:hypothetical protein
VLLPHRQITCMIFSSSLVRGTLAGSFCTSSPIVLGD